MQTSDTLDCLIAQGFSKTILKRFWSKINKDGPIPEHMPELGPCWLWTSATDFGGYGRIGKGPRGAGMMPAHRFSWMIHLGDIPDNLCALHKCDVRLCVRPDHLFLGTKHDNTQDMMSKGRHVRAAMKLTENEVVEILTIGRTIPARQIALKYNVHPHTIIDIFLGKTWNHISRDKYPNLIPKGRTGAKLNAEQVAEIRKLGDSLYQREIAAIYGVGRATIENILQRKTWKHILPQPSQPTS